jgi:hypothetical protein
VAGGLLCVFSHRVIHRGSLVVCCRCYPEWIALQHNRAACSCGREHVHPLHRRNKRREQGAWRTHTASRPRPTSPSFCTPGLPRRVIFSAARFLPLAVRPPLVRRSRPQLPILVLAARFHQIKCEPAHAFMPICFICIRGGRKVR